LSGEPDQFDLDGAVLRRSETELRAFIEALAVRLEGAFPGRVAVERKRDGLLSQTKHVTKIAVRGERAVYEIARDRSGLTATRAKLVRGVNISSSAISAREWLAEVRAELQSLAERAGSTSDALHGFL
jgi:hypothetical protein